MAHRIADALRNDPAFREPVRGSLTLVDRADRIDGLADLPGAAAVRIRWHSSRPAIVSDRDMVRGDDVLRKGVVKRQRSDTIVRLTATILLPGTAPARVPIDLTIRAAPVRRAPMAAYTFVYFTGDTIDGEKLRFAVSDGNNALQWQELNGARPILASTAGTRGLRDPFLLRSAEGDRFFLLATDLSAGRTGWKTATKDGSLHLEIWESTDLIHWSAQRHVRVNTPDAGMTWAPEATYDPAIDAYFVYWTSTRFLDGAHDRPDGNGPQILMSTTRDFRSFSPPVPWFKAADLPELVRDKGMIDATVLSVGDDRYRFTKVTQRTGCPSADILLQHSRSLRAPMASGAWTTLDRCIGRSAGTPEVEGPSAFAANPGDVSGYRYFLWVDHYGGVGYIPLATNALRGPLHWTYPKVFRLPRSPRHGSVLSISTDERAALVSRWGARAIGQEATAR